MLTVSRFSFTTQHVTLRLVWILQNLSEVRRDCVCGEGIVTVGKENVQSKKSDPAFLGERPALLG